MFEYLNNKKVLLTGHTGFKGSWMSKILLKYGADVCGYSLEPDSSPAIFNILDLSSNMKSVIGDIRDREKLDKVFNEFKPEYVIHMAAQPIVRESYKDPIYTYEVNVMGTANLLESVRKSESVKSVLNITTDKVYLNNDDDKAYTENDYLDGYDPYSNSKSCSELVTSSYKKSFLKEKGIRVSTVRAGNVIGGGDFAKDRIIPDCVRAAYKDETMIIRNPYAVRPFQHVLEPLFIYLDILNKQTSDEKYEGSFNVGPDIEDCVEVDKLVSMFKKYWNEKFRYEIKSDKGPHEAKFLKLNCNKLKDIYGWKPCIDIEGACRLSVEWYKAYIEGCDMNIVCDEQIKYFLGLKNN